MGTVQFDRNTFHQITIMDLSTRSPSVFTVPKRYSNLVFLNAGAQGTVVVADDSVTKTKVAIKKMMQPFVMAMSAKRAYREFVLLTSIKHKNIIKLLNAFTPETDLKTFSEIYLVMELMAHSLHNVIRTIKFSHKELSFLVYQSLCAIRHLHQSGIIHRDLKPSNIVVSDRCELRVLDFGLARKKHIDTTWMSNYVVTRYYRAPEVILEIPYTEKVDIWSIGCIFAEMINQTILFPGRDRTDQWVKIQSIMGSPPEAFIRKLSDSAARYVRSRTSIPQKMEDIIPDSSFRKDTEEGDFNALQARDLLSRMLIINPDDRCSVEDALDHPYIRMWWRGQSNEKLAFEEVYAPSSDSRRYDEDIDFGDKSLNEWKALIFTEVKLYERQHNIHNSNG